MKLILMALAVLGMVIASGCKSPGCAIEAAAANAGTSYLVSQGCTNSVQIESDLTAILGKTGICAPTPSPALGANPIPINPVGLICPTVVSIGVGYLSGQIPSNWNCPANMDQNLQAQLTAACEAMIPATQKSLKKLKQ